jgi:hypothetical protein
MYAAAPPPTAPAPRHHGWAIAAVLLTALCLGVLAAVILSQDDASTSQTGPSIDLTQGTIVEPSQTVTTPPSTVTTPPSTVTVQPDVTVQPPTDTTSPDSDQTGTGTTP